MSERAAHRDIRFAAEFRLHLAVGGNDFISQLLRQLGVDDPAADLCTGCGQCIDVIDIQRLQGVADACRQAVVFQVVPEGLRRGGKTVGHPHTLAGEGLVHLAERGVLAANQRYIIDAEFAETPDVVEALHECCPRLAMCMC